MRASGDERLRSTAPPNSSSLNTTQHPNIPDSFFFDAPTVNASIAASESPYPSALLVSNTDAEGTSGLATPLTPAAYTSGNDSLCRRGQAYRLANTSAITPRVRSLEQTAAAMKTDLELGSHTLSSTLAAAPLTREALTEHLQDLPVRPFSATPPAAHDGLPLLHPVDATAASTGASGELMSLTQHPVEDNEGSVHVAQRAPPVATALRRRQSLDVDEGFELSMESVALRVSERRYFRMHPVTYLEDCSLHIVPGSMHCISSLNPMHARAALAVLAGVSTTTAMTGAAIANALPTSSLRYRRRVAYVSSLDCCTEEATVYENLAFATSVRFLVDSVTLRDVVEQAASDVFLMNHLHTRASDLGPARRYLLATAMELVANPTVLLLEDPLSYFSLSELQMFMQLLHSVRRRNPARTVVWSGSAIPWTLFDSIDSLTLLTTGGKTFYTGSKKNVEAFLQADLGILRVPGEDVMDIMAQTEVDAVAVTHSTISFRQSKFHREVLHDIEAHRTRIAANAFPTSPDSVRPRPSYASVQASLILFTLRRNVLGKAALVPWAGLFVVMTLVCILVAVADGKEEKNVQNTCGVLFLLLSCSVQINSIFFKTELRDWRTFLSFRNNHYVPVAPYYVATMVRLIVPRLCVALVGSVAGALILSTATAFSLSATLSLLSFAHACLGLTALYWFPRVEWLMAANHLYYAYCVIFCGYLVSVAQVPVVFQILSILRIAYGGVLTEEIESLTWCDKSASSSSSSSADVPTMSPDCFTGRVYLTMMGLQNDGVGQSILGLLLVSLVCMAAMLLSMHLSPSTKLFSFP